MKLSEVGFVNSVGGKAVFRGLPVHGEPGRPSLPVYSATFLLPPEADLRQLRFAIEGGEIVTLPGTYAVAPAPPVTVNGEPLRPTSAVIEGGKDLAVYGRNAFYPESRMSPARLGRCGRFQLAEVQVSPYRYSPQSGKLQLLSGASLVAHVVTGPDRALSGAPLASAVDARMQQQLKGLVVNFTEGLKAYPAPAVGLAASPATYLILSTDAIRRGSVQLGPFADAKQKNWVVELVTESGLWSRKGGAWVNVAGGWGGGTGDLAAERMRGWLRANWAGRGIQDVLLIGNPDPTSGDVPMKLCRPRNDATDYPEAPTDFYYGELTGTWDLNGDGVYGDFATDFGVGGADKYSEVTVGRIPFYGKLGDLDHILEKSTQYANATDTTWRSAVLLPMKPSDEYTLGYQLGEQIRSNFVLPKAWSSTRIDEENYGVGAEVYPCTYATVLNAWLRGNFGMATWWTHGWDRGAADVMTTENARLLNDQRPAFTFQCSCLNGTPETPDNLGYALLLNGAVGTVSATRVSWYCPGETDFTGVTNTISTMAYQFSGQMLGAGLEAGRALDRLRTLMTIDANVWWMNALVFNLYGDPSLSLGSHGDAAVAISLQPSAATITAGSTFQFQASVTGATNTSAVWSVLESAGGSVSASGLYTAPAQAGTYHVRATCGADSSLHADATVTVTGAAEYIEGAVWANGALTFHFTPSAPSSWVDVHYKTSRNAVLQNYRMVLAGSTWGSSTVPSPGLQSGDTVTYSYTYAKPLGAADSPWITQAVGSPLK